MNGTEQQTHRTRTLELQKELDDMWLVVSAVDDAQAENAKRTLRAANRHAETLVHALAHERDHSLTARLRWLFLGR